MTRHRGRFTPPAPKGRRAVAEFYGLPPNALQPYDGEPIVGVPVICDAEGTEWIVTGEVGQELRRTLAAGCAECGEEHDVGH